MTDRALPLQLLARRDRRALVAAGAALLVTVACTAPQPSVGPAAQQQPVPRGEPKVVIVAGPDAISGFGSRNPSGTGSNAATQLVEAGLALPDERTGQPVPQLAEAFPSRDSGSWKLNPDGTMETVYRLRPNLTWHDGTPFTVRDFVFGWELSQDPKYPYANREPGDQISRMDAPDDRTLVIYWKTTIREAGSLFRNKLTARPRHILEAGHLSGEIDQVVNHPWWHRNFVHTGPFKLVEFSPGEGATFEAFDGYAFGRPKVDRIMWRSIPDPNAALAYVLANEVDITVDNALGFEQAVVAKEQWADRGNGTVDFTGTGVESIVPGPRNPLFGDVRVRRALLHAIDRDTMVQTLFQGLAPVADFVLSPKHPWMPRLMERVTVYKYDPGRAASLLEEVGWRKGADGVLVNALGERFDVEALTQADNRERERAQAASIEYLKQAGLSVRIANIPARTLDRSETLGTFSGLFWTGRGAAWDDFVDKFHSDNIPRAEVRWNGANFPLWRLDDLVNGAVNSLDDQQRLDAGMRIAETFSQEMRQLPLYFRTGQTTWRSRVLGVVPKLEGGGERTSTWNAHEWDVI